MTAGELAVLMAAVLCCIGFAALVVVLMRVLDSLKALLEQAKRSEAGGTASRLDVELAQSQAYGAELAVVQAEVEQTASVVALYRMAGLAKPGEPLLK